LNGGAEAFVDVPSDMIDTRVIAEMELEAKKIPFIIRRPLPNGTSEYWKVSDLIANAN
jgi:DNA-directed RNA polymerase subunit K/omega